VTVASKKILIVGPSWVGDMVMAQSLFMTIKEQQPNCQIDVLAPQWSFPLLERMPEVTDAIEMPLTHGQFGWGLRKTIGKQLQARHYDQAILLPNSWKSALIPFFAKIPLRTGFLGEMRRGLLNDVRTLDKQRLSMTVQRFVALGLTKNAPIPEQFPIPKLTIQQDTQIVVASKFAVTVNDKILALCPGAEYGPAKRWPVAYYAEIARQKIEQGWQVWLFGSTKDVAVAEQINVATQNRCTDFSGKTSMAEAVDLMSLVNTVISNDSGLMHVAAALNKKLVAIYGSSDPKFTPPLNTGAKILNLNLECAPCFKRECPLGHTNCLVDLLPLQVLAEIEE
jgi:heptosyltransferase-2